MPRLDLGDPLPVDDLQDRYAGWRSELVYEWIEGRPTYRLTSRESEVRYLKITPAGAGLPDEATRLRWAAEWARVPRLIEYGSDGLRDWLMTAELRGVAAVAHPWRVSDPARLAVEFARGLRAFHEAIPVDECPFDFTVETAARQVRARAAAGLADPAVLGSLSVDEALARVSVLAQAVLSDPGEDLVVCHGDYCLPNALLVDGRVTGYLDLDRVAVADRWLDLAVALRSLGRPYNLGPGYEQAFLSAYGAELDETKRELYLLLYDLAR
jgi:kanamycin kinase